MKQKELIHCLFLECKTVQSISSLKSYVFYFIVSFINLYCPSILICKVSPLYQIKFKIQDTKMW